MSARTASSGVAGAAKACPGRTVGTSTLYRGRSGQWAFVLHRVSGFLVFLFLLLHVVDVSLVKSPTIYNEVHALYGNIALRLFEVGLLAALLYHALNGLRIVMIDFFPGAARSQRQMFGVVVGLTALGTVVGGVVIVGPFVTGTLGL
jgi:succinate dehydrogenase / fumarate reductase cytochrome b subunit